MSPSDGDDIGRVERDLKRWLAARAEGGVPELVLVGLLRSNAEAIERTGYIPRAWRSAGAPDEGE